MVKSIFMLERLHKDGMLDSVESIFVSQFKCHELQPKSISFNYVYDLRTWIQISLSALAHNCVCQ